MNTRRAAARYPWAPVLAVLLAIATDVRAAAVASGPTTAAAAGDATPTAVQGAAEGRGHFKDMMMNPYMLIPQLISLGFAPIVLANLKMLVMNALMINNMALNAAIFMTVRNMVFGPRPKVKYVNYGYREDGHHHGGHVHHRDDDHHQQHHQHHHDPLQQQEQPQQQLTEEEAQMAEYRRRRGRRKTSVVGS